MVMDSSIFPVRFLSNVISVKIDVDIILQTINLFSLRIKEIECDIHIIILCEKAK